jgi:hypothetical protein
MIRSALLFCAAVIVAACFACVPPPPAGPAAPPMRGPTVATCDATNPVPFLSRVYMLTDYVPNPPIHNSLPVGMQPVPDPYCTSLTNAYNSALPAVQRQLNNITATFITTCTVSNCAPEWGLIDRQSNPQNTYVALSSGLWRGGAVPKYSAFEGMVTTRLLGASIPNFSVTPVPDTSDITILAAIAHELGHIKWWQYKVETTACANPPKGSQPFFADHSWGHNRPATPLFQPFGQEWPGNTPAGGVDKDQLKRDLGKTQEYQDLATIYNGEWAGVFGTVSPDEDFVEVYKMALLLPMFSSLTVTLPTTSLLTNVPIGTYATNPNYHLYNKVQWVQACAP